MHITRSTCLLSALFAFMLSGCSTQPAQSINEQNWQQHQQHLMQQQHWQLQGKMGYRHQGDGGSAWIDWQQAEHQFDVRLSGPFGAGTTYLKNQPGFTQLIQSGKEPIVADSATELTYRLFGWQWPVDDLQYWVRGLPSPTANTDKLTLTPQQLLATLQQSGWQLVFSRYSEHDGYLLPGKIRGVRLNDDSNTSFTLIIKSWQIEPST